MKKLMIAFILLFFSNILFADNDFLETLQNASNKNSKTVLILYKTDCPF